MAEKFKDESGNEWEECARFSDKRFRNIERPKGGYEYVTVHRRSPPIQEWKISHPGEDYYCTCATFEECMNRWFEGFNMPILFTDGVPENFTKSRRRVQEYFESKRKA